MTRTKHIFPSSAKHKTCRSRNYPTMHPKGRNKSGKNLENVLLVYLQELTLPKVQMASQIAEAGQCCALGKKCCALGDKYFILCPSFCLSV